MTHLHSLLAEDREKEATNDQSTREIWVPKLDHKEDERTAIPEGKKKEKKEQQTEKSKGMVTLPYVKRVTKPVQRILKHQEIAISVRHQQNIRKILAHPKDKVEDKKRHTVSTRSLVRAVTVYRRNRENIWNNTRRT